MREIKFRAWIDENSKWTGSREVGMFTGFSFEDIYSGHDESNVRCEDGRNIEEPEWSKIILMQYTGLKDSLEKEIYEGDVIRSRETSEVLKVGKFVPISRHLDFIAENIGYFDDKEKFHLRSAGGQYHLDDWISNPEFYEVIGNIYEGIFIEENLRRSK